MSHRSIYHSSFTPLRNSLVKRFIHSPTQYLSVKVSLASCDLRIRPRHDLVQQFNNTLRLKVSSEDVQFNLLMGNNNEFITSKRVRVVALLALALALCNAGLVVMSVGIVPLPLSYGWSRSFSGIVQGFFVILSWMPIYFYSLRHATWFSAIPWSVMAIMGYFGGVLSDMLIKQGITVTLTRKMMQAIEHSSIGLIGPGIALVGLTIARTPSIASAWLTVAVGLKSFSHSGFLVNLQEMAPKYFGVLHGISNTAGTLAAIIGTVEAGFFIELVGSFQGFLLLTSFLYLFAAVFYDIFSTGE